MEENTFFLIKKKSGGIDVNLHGVKIAYESCKLEQMTFDFKEAFDSIFFVIKGKGWLRLSEKSLFELKSGTAFYIPKGTSAYCSTSDDDYFEYYKLVIDSLDSRRMFNQMGLSKEHPLIYFNDELASVLSDLYELVTQTSATSTYKSVSLLYEIFSILAKDEDAEKSSSNMNEYVEKALNYISAKYYDSININSIVDALNINRSYFSSLFKSTMGVSPLQYLTEFRVAQACKLLAMGKTVTEAAMLSGFNTPTNFSSNFKRVMKMTPQEYKKNFYQKEKRKDEKID